MSDYIVCEHCGRNEVEIRAQMCECGSCYCSFHCLAESLRKVGVNQYTFDELDRCGRCAVEKLKAGRLTFPQGDKHLNRLLAPHLLIYTLGEVKPVKRKKKVSENQLSLF